MRDRKPQAHKFTDGDGFWTERCKTKEQAVEAIKAYMKNDDDFVGVVVSVEDIKDETAYYHRSCGYTTFEAPECLGCGDYMKGHGKPTFTFYY